MKKSVLFFLIVFSIRFLGFSQIQKGTYVSDMKGQTIKLTLSDDNKYDLSVFSGDYIVKNDTIALINSAPKSSLFEVKYKFDSSLKSDKIKVNFLDMNYSYSTYFGTQDGSLPVQYRKVVDLGSEKSYDAIDSTGLNCTILRPKYIYLVENDEYSENNAKIHKFLLPSNVTEIEVTYNQNLSSDIELNGFYDKETKKLVIAQGKTARNPLTFQLENTIVPVTKTTISADEIKEVKNWTYPGKNTAASAGASSTMDVAVEAASEAPKQTNFKYKIENSLSSAIAATKKQDTKFLVVYCDANNTNSKTEFDSFVIDQQADFDYNLENGYYNAKNDCYNYYLATKKDTKWMTENKIIDFPAIAIVNGNGEVMSVIKSSIQNARYHLTYTENLFADMKRVNALLKLQKTLNKSYNETELLNNLSEFSSITKRYDGINVIQDVIMTPPQPVLEQKEEVMPKTDSIKEETVQKVEEQIVEAPPAVEEIASSDDFVPVNKVVNIDKQKLESYWYKLIQSHKNDSNPDMKLVEIITKEIKSEGFSNQSFGGDSNQISETNFVSIDYLLKHADAIDKINSTPKPNAKTSDDYEVLPIKIHSEISATLNLQSDKIRDSNSTELQNKAIILYKKLIQKDQYNMDNYRNYFYLLKNIASKSGNENQYIQEYEIFFNENFTGKSVIETLDTMFNNKVTQDEYSYEGWKDFKNFYSNLSNEIAWFVVEKSKNPDHIKKAIKWSESSLQIEKNNHYYLDTLAQLYYKNGEKAKGISFEEEAIKAVTKADDSYDALSEYQLVLDKMKNGTY
jgi:hypothetical protein